jgi:hypothetical protein
MMGGRGEVIRFEIGDLRFEIGDLRFEIGDWRFEIGDWGAITIGWESPHVLQDTCWLGRNGGFQTILHDWQRVAKDEPTAAQDAFFCRCRPPCCGHTSPIG